MGLHKELYKIITSSEYSENIHIPFLLNIGCTSFSLYNQGEVSVNVIVKNILIPIPPNCSSGEIRFERDYFNEITIDTELGHNFILELYRD